MTWAELEKYASSLINAINDEASTYSNNVKVSIKGNKLRVIFNSPTAFKLDNELYFYKSNYWNYLNYYIYIFLL